MNAFCFSFDSLRSRRESTQHLCQHHREPFYHWLCYSVKYQSSQKSVFTHIFSSMLNMNGEALHGKLGL